MAFQKRAHSFQTNCLPRARPDWRLKFHPSCFPWIVNGFANMCFPLKRTEIWVPALLNLCKSHSRSCGVIIHFWFMHTVLAHPDVIFVSCEPQFTNECDLVTVLLIWAWKSSVIGSEGQKRRSSLWEYIIQNFADINIVLEQKHCLLTTSKSRGGSFFVTP